LTARNKRYRFSCKNIPATLPTPWDNKLLL
jgi:hypothetical protein